MNLCEILKTHEGETFYSPIAGNIILNWIDTDNIYPLSFQDTNGQFIHFTSEGRYNIAFKNSEIIVFPSKDQRDWNKWVEKQKPKIPKTWSELNNYKDVNVKINKKEHKDYTVNNTLIEKSALSLLKIHQLIDIGYGGNITDEEWNNSKTKYIIVPGYNKNYYYPITTITIFSHIAFHTEEQAREFLSYKENIQLLTDYFML